MKKTIFLFSLVAGLFTANAQTANATINVNLKPFQSIIVNTGQTDVDLDFVDADDYEDGVTSEQVNHLNVYSTGAFEITVMSAASATDLTTTSLNPDDKKIAIGDIKITATDGGLNPLTGADMPTVTLATTDQPLITSDAGGFNKNFNVTYTADGDYVNHYLDGATGNDTTYSVDVVYTIATR